MIEAMSAAPFVWLQDGRPDWGSIRPPGAPPASGGGYSHHGHSHGPGTPSHAH